MLARVGDDVRSLALLLLIATLLLVAGALAVSPDRRRTVVELGVGAATGGVVLVVAYAVVRSIAVGHVETPEGRAAAGAVWDAFLGDLRTAAWILAGAGAVTAAAAASLIKPVDIREPLRRAAGWVTTEPEAPRAAGAPRARLSDRGTAAARRPRRRVQPPGHARGRLPHLRGGQRVPPARLPRTRPRSPRQPARTSVAACRDGWRVSAIGRRPDRPDGRDLRGVRRNEHGRAVRRTLQRARGAVRPPVRPGGAAGNPQRDVRAAPGLVFVGAGTPDRRPARRRDQRAAGGHPLRRPAPERQAAHLLRLPGGAAPAAKQDGVSPEAVDAALRIREPARLRGQGRSAACISATPSASWEAPRSGRCSTTSTTSSSSNPDDVLVVINQDYVTPKDFVAAVKDAGLEDLVYRGPTTGSGRPCGR